MPDRARLAKIHMGKKALALRDEDYRAILDRIAGVASSAQMTDAGADAVLAEFARLGWVANKRFAGKPASKPGVRLIFGLWSELGRLGAVTPTRAALCAFVERQTGIANPEWLSAAEVNKVVEGLKAMVRRAKTKTTGAAS